MTADVVLVLNQMFSQQISFETGVMTCRNQQSNNNFVNSLSRVSPKDFEEASSTHDQTYNDNVEQIIKSITAKCKSVDHTTEASQDAQKTSACYDGSFWMEQPVFHAFVYDYLLIQTMR